MAEPQIISFEAPQITALDGTLGPIENVFMLDQLLNPWFTANACMAPGRANIPNALKVDALLPLKGLIYGFFFFLDNGLL